MSSGKEIVRYPEVGRCYRHYKGGSYEFLFIAPHSESDDKLVIYRSLLYGSYHARPLNMWFDKVDINGDGNTVSRFELI